ncbi:Cutinase transcription factor 1 beta [Cadophora gregata]|uniref:Cutinase transcription factor 1 beta n=1 Tax=Cadophora gregata TaxID=51156 RepID=UPI0026DB5CE0|nr:Cutinase transcription factor 1 beta [Cadophora gregata]KAK0101202.1 Cutinase transcription factor 1 beta [Cadophora gregata f. sp. sojae]KAK0115763.1 Cutinase transcription factor 1 beta [Cadophora gregata]
MFRRQGFIATQYDPDPTYTLLTSASLSGDLTKTRLATPPILLKHQLPAYLKPLPQRMTSVDIDYLFAKGALSLPDTPVRDALLRAYCEFVHPYMPLLELHNVLEIMNDSTGESGKISLLLFQAIMFAGTAFVDMSQLVAAGYTNRKAARKAFFQKARVLYDFDYEIDRVSLVQSLLLMTYWYETPDDQKDTWHWMGVAISLAHTIGLHRNPENSNMEPAKKKLWKRIWWSCFMRDRLIALGMRRPTRVKDEDYDVPMLVEEDFEIGVLSENITIIPQDCTLMRTPSIQLELAQMCIAKAKLCLCISHVLSAQYSVLVRHQGMQGQEGSTRSSVMLFPKKLDQTDEVTRCDEELQEWVRDLPPACHYTEFIGPGQAGETVFVQRSLLHMVYYTTLSALHRPQVLPCAGTSGAQPDSSRELQDLSRKQVREASREITKISQNIHEHNLEKYLPTTGVTVLLPAIIIHLLDIKSCNDEARRAAMNGFCQCMLVLEKLRDNYASADFATQFLEAAIRKADIDMVIPSSMARSHMRHEDIQNTLASQKVREVREKVKMMYSARRMSPPGEADDAVQHLPMDSGYSGMENGQIVNGGGLEHNLAASSLLAHTPPDSDSHTASAFSPPPANGAQSQSQDPLSSHTNNTNNNPYSSSNTNTNITPLFPGSLSLTGNEFDANVDLSDFLNFDGAGGANDLWSLPLDEGAHGESGGFMGDMSWVDQGPGWSRMHSPVPGEDFFSSAAVGVGVGAGTKGGEVDVAA